MEIWKDIDDTNGYYQVSNMGNVRSLFYWDRKKEKYIKRDVPKIMLGTTSSRGDRVVGLSKNNRVRNYLVYKLVADAFMEKPKTENQLYHINNNKTDNRVVNLGWRRRQRNDGKISTEKAQAIINDYQNGMPYKSICEKYSIKRKALYRCLRLNNIDRTRLNNNEFYPNRQPKLNEHEKTKIVNSYEDGAFTREIIEKFDISSQLLSKARDEKRTTIRYVNKYRYTYLDWEWMFTQNMTNKEIKDIVGCSEPFVVKRRKQWQEGVFEKLKEKQDRKNERNKKEESVKEIV